MCNGHKQETRVANHYQAKVVFCFTMARPRETLGTTHMLQSTSINCSETRKWNISTIDFQFSPLAVKKHSMGHCTGEKNAWFCGFLFFVVCAFVLLWRKETLQATRNIPFLLSDGFKTLTQKWLVLFRRLAPLSFFPLHDDVRYLLVDIKSRKRDIPASLWATGVTQSDWCKHANHFRA